jgi:hypothetical protein
MAPTAADVLAEFHRLPPDQQRAVRSALWPRKARAGPAARRAFADRRYGAVHALILELRLPTFGRFAWGRILAKLAERHPELCYSRPFPAGQSLDMLPALWVAKHFLKPAALRRGYLAWKRRNAT